MIEPIERSGLWKGTSFKAKSVPFPGRGASNDGAAHSPLRNLQNWSLLQAALMRRGVWPDMPGAMFALCLLTTSRSKS